MTYWEWIDTELDCKQKLTTTAPPCALDVMLALSADNIPLIFHEKLESIVLRRCSFRKKHHSWMRKQQPAASKLWMRQLFICHNKVNILPQTVYQARLRVHYHIHLDNKSQNAAGQPYSREIKPSEVLPKQVIMFRFKC